MTPGPGGLSSDPTPGKFEGSPPAFWASLALLSSALEKGGEVWRNHPALGRQESCLRDSNQFRRLTLQVRNDIPTLSLHSESWVGRSPGHRGSQKKEARTQVMTGEHFPGASQVRAVHPGLYGPREQKDTSASFPVP